MTCIPRAHSAEKNPAEAKAFGKTEYKYFSFPRRGEVTLITLPLLMWTQLGNVSVSCEFPDACCTGKCWRVCADVKELWLFWEWRRTGTWVDLSLAALCCSPCSILHKPGSIRAPIYPSKCWLSKPARFIIYATEELGEESFKPHLSAFWIWMKWWIDYYYSRNKGRTNWSSGWGLPVFKLYH